MLNHSRLTESVEEGIAHKHDNRALPDSHHGHGSTDIYALEFGRDFVERELI